MEFLKKGLLWVTLVAVMSITKTEQSDVEKLAAKKLEKIEQQEKEQKENKKRNKKHMIKEKARRKLFKKQRKQEERRELVRQIDNLNTKASKLHQQIRQNDDKAGTFIAFFGTISLLTLGFLLEHIDFRIFPKLHYYNKILKSIYLNKKSYILTKMYDFLFKNNKGNIR